MQTLYRPYVENEKRGIRKYIKADNGNLYLLHSSAPESEAFACLDQQLAQGTLKRMQDSGVLPTEGWDWKLEVIKKKLY
jgi:hypothetical protein